MVVTLVLQPWYADDAVVVGNFDEVKKVFSLLQTTGPARGYFPEPTNSVLVVKHSMFEGTKAHFDHLGFTFVTGTRYMGGFIGIRSDQSSHIRQKPPKPLSPFSSRATNTSGSIFNA